jgi:hypothetical protein
VVRLGFIIAARINQYRNSRRIHRGMAAYLKQTVGAKDN